MDLDKDGVKVLKNIFSMQDIEIFRNIYFTSWNEIKNNYPLKWNTINYKLTCYKYDNFIGMDLYSGKHYCNYKDSVIFNMGKNRFDFTYNLDMLKDKIIMPKTITELLQNKLNCEYDYYYGGLPVEMIMNEDKIDINNINGYWHRDAYSLFNNEKVDLSLPPFYYTMLIPLDHVDAYSGGTEFILGSHKTNLSEMNITTNKQLCEWIDKNNDIQYVPELNIGDICIFHGYTIHRGLFNHANTNRNMIYCVFKKNWYNDEPIENYL
jgi:hypothetical protein